MNHHFRAKLVLGLTTLSIGACAHSQPSQSLRLPADQIFYNANILTMDPVLDQGLMEAIAITGDTITAVGSTTDVMKFAGPSTVKIDLKKQGLVMPGFVEPHSHPDFTTLAEITGFVVSISPIDDFAKRKVVTYPGQKSYSKLLAQKIRPAIVRSVDRDQHLSQKYGIIFFGWDPMFYGPTDGGFGCTPPWQNCDSDDNLPWLDNPSTMPKQVIDKEFFLPGESTDVPVAILLQSMHTLYTNQAWLDRYPGIEAACPKNDGPSSHFCRRAPSGELIGRFEEAEGVGLAIREYMKTSAEKHPLAFTQAVEESWQRTIRSYHSVGVSTVGVMGIRSFETWVLRLAGRLSRLRMPLFRAGHVPKPPTGATDCTDSNNEESKDTFKGENEVDRNWTRVIGTKLWYDGSPYSGSMYMSEVNQQYYTTTWLAQQLGIPIYVDTSIGERHDKNWGHQTYPSKCFAKAATAALSKGMLAVHTQGSQAGADTLALYDNCITGDDKVKCRLEHNGFLSKSNVKLAKEHGVHLSFHVLHLYWYGADFSSILNPAALESVLPIKTAINSGSRVSFHTDSPMYPPDPLLAVRTAVVRKTFKTGAPLDPTQPLKQSISVEQGLKAITIDAAHALNMEDEVGSLKPGNLADLVFLSQDPRVVSPESINEIEIQRLIVGGKPVPL